MIDMTRIEIREDGTESGKQRDVSGQLNSEEIKRMENGSRQLSQKGCNGEYNLGIKPKRWIRNNCSIYQLSFHVFLFASLSLDVDIYYCFVKNNNTMLVCK